MFGIPELEKRTFNNDFINNVIVSGEYISNRSCAEHRQTLKDRYAGILPIQNDVPQQQYQINIDVKTNQTSVNADVNESERQITLRSRNMQKELSLTNNNFQYRESGNVYGTSVTFNDAVRPALTYLAEVGVTSLNKLQLRKINVVGFELNTVNPANSVIAWQPASSLINERLIARYQAMLDVSSNIKQHISTLQLADGDYMLTIKYGFHVLEKKADGSSVKGQVIIDLDIARQSAINTDGAIDELCMMHQELFNAFNWCISEEFIRLLNREAGIS